MNKQRNGRPVRGKSKMSKWQQGICVWLVAGKHQIKRKREASVSMIMAFSRRASLPDMLGVEFQHSLGQGSICGPLAA